MFLLLTPGIEICVSPPNSVLISSKLSKALKPFFKFFLASLVKVLSDLPSGFVAFK